MPGHLACKSLGALPGKNLGTCWQLDHLVLETCLGNLPGNLGNFAWEPVFGNLFLRTLLGNLLLGTWEKLGNADFGCSLLRTFTMALQTPSLRGKGGPMD